MLPARADAPVRTLTAREALLALGLTPIAREEIGAGAIHWRARREQGDDVSVALVAGAAAEALARAAQRVPRADGLPRLLEVRRGPGFRALVYEPFHGPSLASEIERRGRLEPRSVLEIGARIAGALGVAHEAGFAHGAVSPASIALGDADSLPGAGALLLGHLVDLSAPLAVAPAGAPAPLAASADQDLVALGRALFAALAGPSTPRPPDASLRTGHASPRPPELAPAARILERCMRLRPELGFYPDGRALAHALESAARRLGEARADLSGRFTREELCGVLQMLEMQRKSGRVELTGPASGDASGALVLREGRIAGARAGLDAGRAAVERLLSLPSGRFRVTFGPVAESGPEIAVSAALLDALRRRDEGA